MNVTIDIPQQGTASPSLMEELKKVLTEYAIQWMAQVGKKKAVQDAEYELPQKYEKLCGCLSEEKIMTACEEDDKMDYLVKKHLK